MNDAKIDVQASSNTQIQEPDLAKTNVPTSSTNIQVQEPERKQPQQPARNLLEQEVKKPLPPRQTKISRKRKKPLWPMITLTMLIVSGVTGWKIYQGSRRSPIEVEETTSVQARLPVRVTRAQQGTAQAWVFDEGTSLPVQLRVLNFYADGDITHVAKINGVPLREGDFVSRGQLLAKVDSRRQNSSLVTSEADIRVAINQRDQAQASVLRAKAELAKAQSDLTLAQTEYQRYQSLFEQGAISASSRDVYSNRIDQAQAAFSIAEQTIDSAQDNVRVAESSIEAAQARRTQTVVDLEDTELISPIDGVVAYINIQEGEYWSSRYLDTSSAQNLIETAPMVVVDPSTYEVEVELQADDANTVRSGQRAYVVLEEAVSTAQASGASQQDLLDIAKQQGSEGRVFAVSPSQTPGSRGTKISIRDFQQIRNLKVGARAYVWIETEVKQDATILPLGSVLARGQDFFAFVVSETDGTVEQRRVTPGVESLAGIEILAGVEPGELVVTAGQNRLVDGTPVEMINQEDVQ
ncbi:MAG: HlyD family efflux transporter periplasmic adaptor subunit [Cyanobacteria bacterium P01_F01_bin.150]